MDIVYIAVALLFWLAVHALARGCARLQARGARR